ncbi:MAG: metallophosphoesterase family protein [Planctomycetota bacterium]
MQRIFAIGDIHGCSIALRALLEAINPQPSDLIVTLGDYVDRGPDSRGVIKTLIELGQRTQTVGILGNHEEMMLNVINGEADHHSWLRFGGVDTLESYQFDGDLDFLPADHIAFFNGLGDYFEYENFFFTHASYDEETALEFQDPTLLRWSSLNSSHPGPHQSGKIAVVGHTANTDGEIIDHGHLIRMDTYCYGGGWLSAMELRTREVIQANQNGVIRQLNGSA